MQDRIMTFKKTWLQGCQISSNIYPLLIYINIFLNSMYEIIMIYEDI